MNVDILYDVVVHLFLAVFRIIKYIIVVVFLLFYHIYVIIMRIMRYFLPKIFFGVVYFFKIASLWLYVIFFRGIVTLVLSIYYFIIKFFIKLYFVIKSIIFIVYDFFKYLWKVITAIFFKVGTVSRRSAHNFRVIRRAFYANNRKNNEDKSLFMIIVQKLIKYIYMVLYKLLYSFLAVMEYGLQIIFHSRVANTIKNVYLFVKRIVVYIYKKVSFVIYNVVLFVDNVFSFTRNILFVIIFLVKTIIFVIVGLFTIRFWKKVKNQLVNVILSIHKHYREWCVRVVKILKHELLYIMKAVISFIKLLFLFLWFDLLNIKKFTRWAKGNIFEFTSLVIVFCVISGGVFYFSNNKIVYGELSKKWSQATKTFGISPIFDSIAGSYLFKPIVYYNVQMEVSAGETLLSILQDRNIDFDNARLVYTKLNQFYNLKHLNPSWIINGVFVSSNNWNKDKVQRLSLPISDTNNLIIEADDSYTYSVYKQEKKLTKYVLRRKVLVKDSIYASAIKAGVPAVVAINVFKLLSWDIDFQRDVRENDVLEVVFDCVYDQDDELVNCDNLLFVSFKNDNKLTSFYKYGSGYYHKDGKSVVKTLVKTPVSNARLSSSFGRRMHPVLGYNALHKGIDFAAPRGTPVYASGSGIIATKYYSASYGNYIKIRHNSNLASAYAHMNNFASKLKVGNRVNQWQLIGYVGATGRVTGAHLHYEVLVNGKQVNPMTIKMPSDSKLTSEQLEDFNIYVSDFDTRAIRIPITGKTIAPNSSYIATNKEDIKNNDKTGTIGAISLEQIKEINIQDKANVVRKKASTNSQKANVTPFEMKETKNKIRSNNVVVKKKVKKTVKKINKSKTKTVVNTVGRKATEIKDKTTQPNNIVTQPSEAPSASSVVTPPLSTPPPIIEKAEVVPSTAN